MRAECTIKPSKFNDRKKKYKRRHNNNNNNNNNNDNNNNNNNLFIFIYLHIPHKLILKTENEKNIYIITKIALL